MAAALRLTLAFQLAGGHWVFLGVIIAIVLGVVFTVGTRAGNAIYKHPLGRGGHGAPGVGSRPSHISSVEDETHQITSFGTDSSEGPHLHHAVAPPPAEGPLAPADVILRDWRRDTHAGVLSVPVDPARDHTRGGDAGSVTLLAYGDYVSPLCRELESTLQALQQQFGEQVTLAYRHFPRTDVHPAIRQAAEAAEIAGGQRQFWPMHRALLAAQPLEDASQLRQVAAELGLDMERFDEQLRSHAYAERIREDIQSGASSGVNATPTVFINGIRHEDEMSLEILSSAVHSALKATGPVTD